MLKPLRTLVAVEETGSFAEVAARLNMTVPAVSMQLKALEAELSAALLDRERRPVKLTALGRRVAAQARRVLAEQEALLALCRPETGLAGDFRVGFVLTASMRLLPGFLGRARERFPQARFRVETGLSDRLVQRVARGGLDAAVVTGGPGTPSGVDTVRLAREELLLCLPAAEAATPLADCMARLPFIHFMRETGIGRLVDRHMAREGWAPAEVLVLDSVEAVAECVRAGVGFSILPEPDIRLRGGGSEIALRPLGPDPVTRDLVLALKPGGPLSPVREALAAALAPAGAEIDADRSTT